LPNLAFDAGRDANLRSVDVSHLFEPEVMHVGVNRTRFHRGYLFSFIEMLAPQLARRKLERLLEAAR
jgi:LysR family cys regulon transcriptional activator